MVRTESFILVREQEANIAGYYDLPSGSNASGANI